MPRLTRDVNCAACGMPLDWDADASLPPIETRRGSFCDSACRVDFLTDDPEAETVRTRPGAPTEAPVDWAMVRRFGREWDAVDD